MGTRFHGWPKGAYPVLHKLGGEPSREARGRVGPHREEHVRQPMIDLLNDLADVDPWHEDFAVWRYASTASWWQNQCAVIRMARNIEIGFRFNLDGLRIKTIKGRPGHWSRRWPPTATSTTAEARPRPSITAERCTQIWGTRTGSSKSPAGPGARDRGRQPAGAGTRPRRNRPMRAGQRCRRQDPDARSVEGYKRIGAAEATQLMAELAKLDTD